MVKTQISHNIELLARLLAADASFLTVREKLIFLDFLLKNDDSSLFQTEKDFESRFLSLKLDDISFAVKRVFPRARWTSSDSLKKIKIAKRIMEVQNIKSTSILDSDFPAMLREMKDPPFMLFYRGKLDILNRKCLSVVGTRRAFPAALRAATDFSRQACDDGLCVVSGLAFGIDGACHKGALLSKNPATVAILPGGIDTISPHSHTGLAAKILEKGGLLMSEYLPGTPAAQFRYVQRNRIVAALSPCTLVFQAAAGSGAMITANLALDYNRELLFHSHCFSKEFEALTQKLGSKKNDSPASFVEEGAKVISDYDEFKKAMLL